MCLRRFTIKMHVTGNTRNGKDDSSLVLKKELPMYIHVSINSLEANLKAVMG
jgi:hypothetical protein